MIYDVKILRGFVCKLCDFGVWRISEGQPPDLSGSPKYKMIAG